MPPTNRSISIQNILIASATPIWVKISDFGISKRTTGTDLRTSCGTAWYKAPEQHGLLPSHMRKRDGYTTAVDLWAFGAVIYQVLTSELPFLDTYHDTDSVTITDYTPQLDMKHLFEYCNGLALFPVDRLEENMVGQDGIDFVKGLMAVNPDNRVSAIDASRSPWLMGINHSGPDASTIGTSASSPQLLQTEFKLLGVSLSDQDANQLYVEADTDKITAILKRSSWTPWLCDAASRGYIEVIKTLLKLKPFGSTSLGEHLLFIAAEAGQIAILELLLNYGVRISRFGNGIGNGTLAVAAGGGHLGAMKLLISRGAVVNPAVTPNGSNTPLQAASQGGHLAAMRMLLDEGADIHVGPRRDEGLTALQAAASGGHVDAMQLLIDEGVEVDEAPAFCTGQTALHGAARGGHVAAIKLLIREQSEINEPPAFDGGRTALQAAAEGGHLQAVELLCSSGAWIKQGPAPENGRTALQAAAGAGHLDVVEFLLANGADVDDDEELGISHGRTAVQAAAGGGHLDMVKLLFSEGAELDQNPGINYGRTAVQAAAGAGHIEVVEFLLENGADVDSDPGMSHGRTALQAAVGGGHLDMVKFLLDNGAEVDNGPGIKFGRTALQAAAEGGKLHIIQLLLDNGAFVNESIADEYGITSFQAAVCGGHVDATELLLNHGGVDIDQPFCVHNTPRSLAEDRTAGDFYLPLEWAVDHQNVKMVKLLVDHQARVTKKILKQARGKPLILKTLRKAILAARSAAECKLLASDLSRIWLGIKLIE